MPQGYKFILGHRVPIQGLIPDAMGGTETNVSFISLLHIISDFDKLVFEVGFRFLPLRPTSGALGA